MCEAGLGGVPSPPKQELHVLFPLTVIFRNGFLGSHREGLFLGSQRPGC